MRKVAIELGRHTPNAPLSLGLVGIERDYRHRKGALIVEKNAFKGRLGGL